MEVGILQQFRRGAFACPGGWYAVWGVPEDFVQVLYFAPCVQQAESAEQAVLQGGRACAPLFFQSFQFCLIR